MSGNTTELAPEPEVLLISALIDSGNYIPEAYGVTDEFFHSDFNVHKFCKKYQETTNEAPPIDFVKATYTNFDYQPGISLKYAVKCLQDKWARRKLESSVAKMSHALRDPHVEPSVSEIVESMEKTVQELRPKAFKASRLTDYELFIDQTDTEVCPVIPGRMTELTGGIHAGDLWYIAARFGVGKSWRLAEHAVAAANAGWDVAYFSLEMPAKAVIDRLHRLILKNYRRPWMELTPEDRKDLIGQWQEQGNGQISVFDPSSGRCDAAVIAGTTGPQTLAIIDYVGLMYTTGGTKSVDDWRAAATISNQLKEVALAQKIPIISAAQINRAGDGEGDRIPKAVNLAQSDALGQDADLILTMSKYSTRVRTNGIVKYRQGASGSKWFTRFEPHRAMMQDISKEEADQMKENDDE